MTGTRAPKTIRKVSKTPAANLLEAARGVAAISGSEHKDAQALWQWRTLMLGRHPELKWLIHIPNEARRSKTLAAMLKSTGLQAGVSDYLLPVARGPYHGMWIELKHGKNKPSDKQEEFIKDMRLQDYYADWVIGYEEAIKRVQWYLAL